MKKRTGTFALALCWGLSAGGASADQVTLRMSHWLPPQHPLAAEGLLPWTESITSESEGTIRFQIFPSAQIGKAEDHYDMARTGVADLAWLNPGFNPGRFPVFAAVQIPTTVNRNGDGATLALNAWYGPYSGKEMGDVHFCLARTLSPLMFHTKFPMEHPADLKGVKLRPSSAMEASYIHHFGGSTVPGGNPEAREMIARGVVDGTTSTNGSLFAFGLDQATTQHLDMPFSAVSFALVMNKAKYDAMTPEQKAVIDRHCTGEAAERFFAPAQRFEDEGLEKIRALDGHVLREPSPEVLAEWREGAKGVIEEWSREVAAKGLDPEEVREGLREALRGHNALNE